MKDSLKSVLTKIGEDYKEVISHGARHYLEVSIARKAAELGLKEAESVDCSDHLDPHSDGRSRRGTIHRVGAGPDLDSGNDADLRAETRGDRRRVLDVHGFHDANAGFVFSRPDHPADHRRLTDGQAGYTTLTRQSGLMREMRLVANNIANAATTGFRQEGLMFSEYVKSWMAAASLSMGQGNVQQHLLCAGRADPNRRHV